MLADKHHNEIDAILSKYPDKHSTLLPLLYLVLVLLLFAVACSPSSPARPSSVAPVASSPIAESTSTIADVPPFPYTAPLPPAIPSVLDGVYTKTIPFEGTPVPCRRCAEYRLEGGVWTLTLDKGVSKVFHPYTEFTAVGSFTVSGDRITLFNDPNCTEDVGTFSWTLQGGLLTLKVIDDPCAIGLRAKNLMSSPWAKIANGQSQKTDPCQPPNREAAITDHWKKPEGCR